MIVVAENDSERKALSDIQKHGYHVLHVFDEQDELPPFTYSVGISANFGAPEIVIVGLPSDIAHPLVNTYCERIRVGEVFTPKTTYPDFLTGLGIQFVSASKTNYDEYFGWCQWFYEGDDFSVLQLVWPSKTKRWPWEGEAAEAYKQRQPLLNQ